MKKLIFVLATVFLVFILPSCKKDYSCVCVDNSGVVMATSTIHNTKSKAIDACVANNLDGYYTCSIK